MAIEEMFTSLPAVTAAQMTDVICAVQGYSSPSSLGLSVQENLQQVFNLFQSNLLLSNAGNPNGAIAGNSYQFCWDTTNSILYVCITSGTASTAVWLRANINSGFTSTPTLGGALILTLQSPYWQLLTGTLNEIVVMPTTSTLAAGMTWAIVNKSTGTVTIQSSGFNTIATLTAGEMALVTCILNSGSTASSWNATVSATSGGVVSITGTANQVIASGSTGAITLSTPQSIGTTSTPNFNGINLTNPLTVANGGTNLTTLTANSILYASSPTAFAQMATTNSAVQVTTNAGVPGYSSTMTNGQMIIGSTGASPAAAALTAGTNIAITNGAASVTIAASGLASVVFTTVTGTTQAMAVNSGYIANNAALVTLTLPTTAAVGTIIYMQGLGAGGWKIAQNALQNIQVGSASSTVGTGGSIASANLYDSCALLCIVANTTWATLGMAQSAGLTIV